MGLDDDGRRAAAMVWLVLFLFIGAFVFAFLREEYVLLVEQ